MPPARATTVELLGLVRVVYCRMKISTRYSVSRQVYYHTLDTCSYIVRVSGPGSKVYLASNEKNNGTNILVQTWYPQPF